MEFNKEEDKKRQKDRMEVLVKNQDFYNTAYCLANNINHKQFVERVKILKGNNLFIS